LKFLLDLRKCVEKKAFRSGLRVAGGQTETASTRWIAARYHAVIFISGKPPRGEPFRNVSPPAGS
jgi:hypothetical protein